MQRILRKVCDCWVLKMLVNDELISILRDSLLGATEIEKRLLNKTIESVSISKVIVSPNAEPSLKLRRIIEDNSGILSSEMIKGFESCEIYLIDEPICNAFATQKNGNKIIVFDGLLQVIRFYINLIKISHLFNLFEPEKQDEADDFLTAGFALLIDFIQTGEDLPEIKDLLPPDFESEAKIGFSASVLFVLCHEVAHLILGHTKATYRSERRLGSLRLDETEKEEKTIEFEADEYAFFAINEDLRDFFISSIVFFLGAVAFAETFCSAKKDSHPLAANRIARLVDFVRFSDDPQARQATFDVIEGELNRYRRLSDYRKIYTENGLEQIKEIMPIIEARSIFNRVLKTIKSKSYFSRN